MKGFITVEKLPIQIQAAQWDPNNPERCEDVLKALFDHGVEQHVTKEGALVIRTLEGDVKADAGDFVLRGIAGEFYPCKEKIFKATYRVIEDVVVPEEAPVDPNQEPPDTSIGLDAPDASLDTHEPGF